MAKDSVFMGTTEVASAKSIGQIMEALQGARPREILSKYGPNGRLWAIEFTLEVGGRIIPFRLPANVDAVFEQIRAGRKYKKPGAERADREQAERVAWRQLFRWVEAQLAYIKTGSVTAPEVFFPYIVTVDGQTLFKALDANGFKSFPRLTGPGA